MDYTITLVLLSIFTCFYIIISHFRHQKSGRAILLPPGPYPLPIIGNIFKLGDKPHHSFATLSKTYGPLMTLKLGSTTAIVVSSREIAYEFFSKHDFSFSSRSLGYTTHTHNRPNLSMILLPVCDQWRRLRRISKEQLFSVRQLDASQELRKKKIQELVDYVNGRCANGKPVNIGQTAATTTLNVLSNFILSIDLAQHDSVSSQDFKELVWALMKLVGTPCLADLFPILRPFDPNGMLKKANLYVGKLIAIFEHHVAKRLQERTTRSSDSPSSNNDIMDVLLEISENEKSFISIDEIRILLFVSDLVYLLFSVYDKLLQDLFIAGTDTTATTLEWAMAELIHNPDKMSKAKSELKEVMGKKDGSFEESDIPQLPYLQSIIKETLRLHPPVTFLVPHKAITDVEIQGYLIPKDAQILCNLWAMGQDQNVWSNPQMFDPERFLDVNIDYKGHDFELIPFGAGRRMCPGLPLADRMLHLMLGSLIYMFDWKIEGGISPQDMDMSDKFGFTLQKNLPLIAIPVKV